LYELLGGNSIGVLQINWIYVTVNEPMFVSGAGYFPRRSGFPPGISDLNFSIKVTKNLALAHRIFML